MKPLILLIEDDEDLVRSLKLFFELKNYELATAYNGKVGLETILNLKIPPELIISDILMPVMNGYDFYMRVSENSEWSRIPFFFLSGKTEPDDIRFGKMLGADDYITKPFSPDKLLEKIDEKIKEFRELKESSKLLEENLKNILKFEEPSLKKLSRADFFYIFYMIWSEGVGPVVKEYFPKNEIPSLNLKDITTQLYKTLIKIYEYEKLLEKNQFTIRVVKDLIEAYALIDKTDANGNLTKGDGSGTFMVCAITPNFHYLQSERIRDTLNKIASNIRTNKEWNIKEYWEKLLEI